MSCQIDPAQLKCDCLAETIPDHVWQACMALSHAVAAEHWMDVELHSFASTAYCMLRCCAMIIKVSEGGSCMCSWSALLCLHATTRSRQANCARPVVLGQLRKHQQATCLVAHHFAHGPCALLPIACTLPGDGHDMHPYMSACDTWQCALDCNAAHEGRWVRGCGRSLWIHDACTNVDFRCSSTASGKLQIPYAGWPHADIQRPLHAPNTMCTTHWTVDTAISSPHSPHTNTKP